MTENRKEHSKYMRSSLVNVGIFVIVQVVFIICEVVNWAPNMNDSNDLVPRMLRSVLESKLFTEWVTLYTEPFFNMCTVFFGVALIFGAMMEIIASVHASRRHVKG